VSSYVVSFSRLVSAAGWAGIGVLSHPGLSPSPLCGSCLIISKARMVVLWRLKRAGVRGAAPDLTWLVF
jgi:hypothetical protein